MDTPKWFFRKRWLLLNMTLFGSYVEFLGFWLGANLAFGRSGNLRIWPFLNPAIAFWHPNECNFIEKLHKNSTKWSKLPHWNQESLSTDTDGHQDLYKTLATENGSVFFLGEAELLGFFFFHQQMCSKILSPTFSRLLCLFKINEERNTPFRLAILASPFLWSCLGGSGIMTLLTFFWKWKSKSV